MGEMTQAVGQGTTDQMAQAFLDRAEVFAALIRNLVQTAEMTAGFEVGDLIDSIRGRVQRMCDQLADLADKARAGGQRIREMLAQCWMLTAAVDPSIRSSSS